MADTLKLERQVEQYESEWKVLECNSVQSLQDTLNGEERNGFQVYAIFPQRPETRFTAVFSRKIGVKTLKLVEEYEARP